MTDNKFIIDPQPIILLSKNIATKRVFDLDKHIYEWWFDSKQEVFFAYQASGPK